MITSSDQISFRDMQPADIAAGLELCRASRWNQLRRDWELFLMLSPAGCRVAIKDERLVGTVTTVSYQNRFSQNGFSHKGFSQNGFSWIGMVLVDSAERRQGIGTQLLQEALEVLKKERLVGLDATPAGREVYVKLGFVDESRLSRMETTVSPDISRGEDNFALRMAKSDLQAVCELDQKVFGADRCVLLEWLFTNAPEYAWLIKQNSRVTGYTFGRHGFNFEHLGPVIAEDGKVAEHLVSACLAECAGKKFILDAAHYDGEWMQWLTSIGFQEQRPFVRMFRGENFVPGLREQQFAILGPEFG
jgi:GNAT superfamily N-acetyltransferase